MDSRLIFLRFQAIAITDGRTEFDGSSPLRIWVQKARQFVLANPHERLFELMEKVSQEV